MSCTYEDMLKQSDSVSLTTDAIPTDDLYAAITSAVLALSISVMFYILQRRLQHYSTGTGDQVHMRWLDAFAKDSGANFVAAVD